MPFQAGRIHGGLTFWQAAVVESGCSQASATLLLDALHRGFDPRAYYRAPAEGAAAWDGVPGVWNTPDPTHPDWRRQLFPVVYQCNRAFTGDFPVHLGDPGTYLTTQVAELVRADVVEAIDHRPQLVMPLSLAVNGAGTKARVIYDARALNIAIPSPAGMTYPSLNDFVRFVHEDDLLIACDLANAYYSWLVVEEARDLLGFELNGRYYRFRCLAMGLAPACHLYQTSTAVFCGALRSWTAAAGSTRGLHVLGYLDDFIIATAREATPFVRWLVSSAACLAGLTLSRPKCRLLGSTSIQALGLIVDARARQFRIPDAKLLRLSDTVAYLLHLLHGSGFAPIRLLQSWCGFVCSLLPCLPGALIYLRPVFEAVAQAELAGESRVPIRSRLFERVLCVFRDVREWQNAYKWRDDSHVTLTAITTDASLSGLGACLFDGVHGIRTTVAFPLPPEIASGDPTIMALEGAAILYGLRHFADTLRNRRVRVLVDNNAALAAARGRGSRHADLNEFAWAIHEELMRLGIAPLVQLDRIVSEDNVQADRASRLMLPSSARHPVVSVSPMSLSDWAEGPHYAPSCFGEDELSSLALRDEVVAALEALAKEKFTIDLCATALNRRTPRFVGPVPTGHRQQVAADVFTFRPPSSEFCLVNPPWAIIGPLWRHLRDSQARGVLLAPERPLDYWYTAVRRHARDVVRVGERGASNVYSRVYADHVPVGDRRHTTGVLAEPLLAVLFDFHAPPAV